MKLIILISIFLLFGAAKAESADESSTKDTSHAISTEDNKQRDSLNPNLVAVEHMALLYLPQRLTYLNVIEAYRQLNEGIRYELYVNVTDEKNNELICYLVVQEKPWLITVWNDNVREITQTNCSTIEEVQNTPQIVINKKYEQNSIFDIHNPGMSADALANLESQILQPNQKPIGWKKQNDEDSSFVTTEEPILTTLMPSDDEDKTETVFEPIIVKEEVTEKIVAKLNQGLHKQITNNFPNNQPEEPIIFKKLKLDFETERPVVEKFEKINIETTTSSLSDDDKNYLDNFFKFYQIGDEMKVDDFQRQVRVDNDRKYHEDETRSKRSIPENAEPFFPSSRSDELEVYRNLLLFEKFKNKFERRYENSLEEQIRYRIFKSNLIKIKELNNMEQGTAKYGLTDFADLTSTEYKMRTGLLQSKHNENHIKNLVADIPDIKLPNSFDWRKRGVVSEVKNQGSCGSCWAFSVIGNIEGLHAIKTGELEEYSEQELLDCDTIDSACGGGEMDDAYKAIEQIGGLELESEYPYKAKKQNCNFNKTMSRVKVSGGIDLPKNETAMALWLVQNGPISIGINANAMQFYRGGISHPWKFLCRHNSLDHGVLIVGFGVSEYPKFNKTLPYWIVKNSWGPGWGEQGYYRIYRGDNSCGITGMATSAVLM